MEIYVVINYYRTAANVAAKLESFSLSTWAPAGSSKWPANAHHQKLTTFTQLNSIPKCGVTATSH